MSLKKDLQWEGCFPGLKNHFPHNWPQIPVAQAYWKAKLHIAPICPSKSTSFWATDFTYKLPEVRGRAVASLSSMNRLYSGNQFSIIQSTEEGKTITQARQLQSGKHESTILSLHELVCFMILMNTHKPKKLNHFFEEDPKRWYHCRNSCICHVQPLAGTARVCRHKPAELVLLSHIYCWW